METDLSYVSIIKSFSNRNVLVIGDFILDVYLKGVSTRLSPEAPVPVVDISEKIPLLGGAANTACNLAALGASVTYCSVIGTDNHGDEAIQLLSAHANIDAGGVIRKSNRETITKTRVVAGTHVITRFDNGTSEPVDKLTSDEIIFFINENYHRFDAIVISDYDKGVITSDIVEALQKLQEQQAKCLAIDSKRLSFFKSLQPTIAKPNYNEAIKILNLAHQSVGRLTQIESKHYHLLKETNAKILLVTLDEEGSIILEKDSVPTHIEAQSVATPHVAGAGDTYLSAFTLSYVSGGETKVSGEIATAAATIAIKKELTTSCSQKELLVHFNSFAKYIFSLKDLAEIANAYHEAGKRVVFTNGCFDILHSGHVAYLHYAKELGDVLIVGVNSDESIRRIKGERRPINPLVDRLHVLSGLAAVDHVIAFGEAEDDTPIRLIKAVRPHIFAKGGDYTIDQLPEAPTVEDAGGKIVFLPHVPAHSTTEIINRINSMIASEKEQLQMTTLE
jgi:D-beta-D-heptose 7-phosphate kinase / D-beta-D-heptose 1-phosphate adenosyltransferase